MTPNQFEHLLTLVALLIQKRTARLRKPISAPQRLALTHRYLFTGESQQSRLSPYFFSHFKTYNSVFQSQKLFFHTTT